MRAACSCVSVTRSPAAWDEPRKTSAPSTIPLTPLPPIALESAAPTMPILSAAARARMADASG